MDRLELDQARVDEERVSAASFADEDLIERIDENGFPTEDETGLLVDRSDREHVAYYQDSNGAWQPSALKRNDDVTNMDDQVGRVVGPGRGREYYQAMNFGWMGWSVTTWRAAEVRDRAPADPEEEAMPIMPPPELPEEPPIP